MFRGFRNGRIAIEPWTRGAAAVLDDIPALQSFWLRIDSPRLGQFSQEEQCPPTWEHAFRCRLLQVPSSTPSPAAPSTHPWTTNVGSTLLYEDTRVNVWDFQVAPDSRCPYHVHRFPYIFINLVHGVTQGVDATGQILPDDPPRHHAPGDVTFVDVPDANDQFPHHAFQNLSPTTPFCQYIVEFKLP
ncbi:Aste57867_18131 [Aphanomyces stellatus]|uniref:Aste57867_18131 protein n=1 Tax=Aphanomyces stellatus TaxID=120398 RepID=A0A485LA58_9STRA|nr:hypothetical protein As57867_018069 [Aphanomyces stellatus]VFT94869.1 Aste57867_18131 [Aphanomyces stellatus]